MRASSALALAWSLAFALSCGEPLAPLSSADSPRELIVRAVGVGAVRLTWKPVAGESVAGYRVERRANQEGEFVALPASIPQAPELVTYLDTDVRPETFYGYRVVTVTSRGDLSAPSVTGGTRTPPPPGIVVTTQSDAPLAAALDPDGYRVALAGADTASAAIGLAAEHRFAPLKPGTYTAVLHGVIGRCDVEGDSVRTVVVPDTGVHTLAPVLYHVRCRDPNRGRIVARVAASGDSAAAHGFQLRLTGIADGTLPDSVRIVSITGSVPSAGGAATFDNLRPGSYEVELRGLDAHCTNPGFSIEPVAVKAASMDTVRFAVVCQSRRENQSGRPLVWRNTWSAASAAPQDKVYLDIAIDATARSAMKIASTQGDLLYDRAVLRFEKASSPPEGGLAVASANENAGVVSVVSIDNAGLGLSGVVRVARLEFTVIGASGATAITRTAVTEVLNANVDDFKDSTRVVEDTLLVGAGGTVKLPPIAKVGGPYTGTAGMALAFSSTGSNDPDGGSITAYKWSFGDGSADAADASPSHTFATAGTYTVTLTVTDDEGATATAQTTATISVAGGGPPPPVKVPPVAQANGPYAGPAGTAIAFSAAGSTDPDGGIVTFRWSFGDNSAEATGLAPSHTYATAGTYTVTLTVTDDEGVSTTATATATVSPSAQAKPLLWSYIFSPLSVADSVVVMTVSYDLSADLAETPGPEALQSFVVDSLKWNPAVLRFFAFNFGPGGIGSSQPNVSAGKLGFSGSLQNGIKTGLLTIATIRFKVIAPTGQVSTTQTWLGALLSPASFVYNGKTELVEGRFVVP
jgi:PKD repeat protein